MPPFLEQARGSQVIMNVVGALAIRESHDHSLIMTGGGAVSRIYLLMAAFSTKML